MLQKRYNSLAISLHWLIALLLIGLVIVAKVMNSLADDDPLRFSLIQWHKSFGILVLLLVTVRILWRITHRPPKLETSMKAWEHFAAGATHLFLYVLMFAIPISGWLMVSASPLNLKTELFGVILWPHIPAVAEIPDKKVISEWLVNIHHWLANGMLVVVIMHVAAAMRHQFLLKDGLMSRMVISRDHELAGDVRHGLLFGVLIAAAGALYLYEQSSNLVEASAENTDAQYVVGFEASQLGEPLNGTFADAEVTLTLDVSSLAAATLVARIGTASVSTGDGQIDSTVVTSDWFASEQYPMATFSSSSIDAASETQFDVSGELTIRDITKSIAFPMDLQKRVATGSFVIDRTDYGVGVGGQDEFVASEVRIHFRVRAE